MVMQHTTSFAGILISCAILALPAHGWEMKQLPEEPGHWGYRPVEEGEQVNPPGFSWSPEDATRYHLQVDDSPDFDSPLYDFEQSRWTSHAPSIVLPVDKGLHWRYRAWREADGWSAWSKVRNFTISPEAAEFPKPPVEELLARIPAEHPRLFLRPETLDALRARLEDDLAPHWKQTLADAEKVLANPPDTTEPPLYPPGTKRGGEEWKKIWWGNRRHGIDVMAGAAKCAFVYRMNGDARMGRMAHDLMMAFAQWDPKGSTQYNYNDEAAMPLLYYPSRTYTWAHDTFTPEEREQIARVMEVRARDCFNHLRKSQHLWKPYASHSNRAWHKMAEVAVAFHDQIPEARDWLDYAITKFYTAYPVWGGADGGWHEGMAYWQSYMIRFNEWAVTMKTALGIDAFDKPFFKETGYYAMYTVPPGARAGAWGDLAQGSGAAQQATLMGLLAAQTGNGHWQWYAEQKGYSLAKQGWFGIAAASLLPRAPTPEAPTSLIPSRVFKDTGLAVLNTSLLDGTKNVQVHFKSSPWGLQSHGYNANNAFMVYVHGVPLLTLTGKRDVHGSPHHQQWMWHTKSDNAILINGEGQRKHSAQSKGYIARYRLGGALEMLEGDASASFEREGTRWLRRLYFFKPDLLLVHDMLNTPEPSTFQWLLHGNARFEIDGNTATTTCEDATAAAEFLYPAGLRITQTDAFDPPPFEWSGIKLNQWHLTAETAEPQTEMHFLVAIRLNGAETPVEATKEDATFRVAVPHAGTRYSFTSGDMDFDVREEKR
jgi:hypothetical protein